MDFIILDYRIQKINGIETVKEILCLKLDQKIILLTSRLFSKKTNFKVGMFKFVTKPVGFGRLLSIIRK